MAALLGVNIDHVATLRQARGTIYPDVLTAALLAESAGADGITVHLREDRRHIQDADVTQLKRHIKTRLNLEMAATQEMLRIAKALQPAYCCLVPEKRAELTTEGGLAVAANQEMLTAYCQELKAAGIQVSLFIDPCLDQIQAAHAVGAQLVEIHTGEYAESRGEAQVAALSRIEAAARFAADVGLIVNAGHGLNYDNVQRIAAIPQIYELNIGHAIIAEAVFSGLMPAVRTMKTLLRNARA